MSIRSRRSFAYCDFITRTVTLTDGNTPESVCAQYDGYNEQTCLSLLNTHGVGFEGFWIEVPGKSKRSHEEGWL